MLALILPAAKTEQGFSLRCFPFFAELERWEERRDGERGRRGKGMSRAVLAADGEVSDRLSRALPNVTYFSGLQRGICIFLEENK